jgi:4'-phosphopantetheinyl transferase
MNVVLHPCPARPQPPALAADEVHVWSLPLAPPPVDLDELRADLTPDEQARAERYRACRIRDQFITCRGFLRRILGEYLGLSPLSVPITYEGSGKPILVNASLRFNLTHAEGLALIAVAHQRVGVDVERVRDVPNAEGLVARFFSAAERDAYNVLPEALRPAAFFRGWTSKEAVIKAVGASIESLDTFDVEMHPERPPTILAARHGAIERGNWSLYAWAPAEDFAAAVAIVND